MDSLFAVGVILTAGFVFGELARLVRLPRVTGYISCGVLLNPAVVPAVPRDFVEHTDLVTHFALAFITFSVGGTLQWKRIRALGSSIVWITLLEAEGAWLLVLAAFATVLTSFGQDLATPLAQSAIPASLLVACLACPTDPTSTLAVIHESEAKGPVSSTILGVAALDDVFGILNFSLAVAVSQLWLAHRGLDVLGTLREPLTSIAGGLLMGLLFGTILNIANKLVRRETEGALIVLVFGVLALCYAVAEVFSFDPLLATMTMGVVVANFSRSQEKIFTMLGRYSEELIFVLFFTLSGMRLDVGSLDGAYGFIALFIVMRALGKYLGVAGGSAVGQAPPTVRRYAFLGLLPQGGIVIGLALALQYNPVLSQMAKPILAIVIGTTLVHELVGPVAAKIALRRSGEAGA